MSVIVGRTHSEIYMRSPERRAAERGNISVYSKTQLKLSFLDDSSLHYMRWSPARMSFPVCLQDSNACPIFSSPLTSPPYVATRNQSTASMLLVSSDWASVSKGKEVQG